MGPLRLPLTLLRRWLWDSWKEIHAESLAGRDAGAFDYKPIVVLLTVALSLTLQEYFGDRSVFTRLFGPAGATDRYMELKSFAWWAGWRVFGYLLIPMVVVVCLPGERLRDYGFSFKGFGKHFWIYLALFGAVLPLVIGASRTRAFLHTYPFYRLAARSTFDLVAWELLYAAQFLSLEFFFRGFMLAGLRHSVGVHAIWIMVVPYTMIHYGKPLPETLGAIFAGLILGTLALRTKSIWSGVLIHVSVALTMDLLALSHCPPGRRCP